jgi:hypothetical protein
MFACGYSRCGTQQLLLRVRSEYGGFDDFNGMFYCMPAEHQKRLSQPSGFCKFYLIVVCALC